jgi:hypothetical protein
LYLAWPQRCGAAESYEFVGLDRVAGDNVYVFNFAWVEGEDACEWQPWVGSMMGVNSSTLRGETWAEGPWGGEASIQWTEQPSQRGAGTYWQWGAAVFVYYLGGQETNDWAEYDLNVERPTISGLNGAWYFGANFVPNNGYYDATRFTADPKYPDPETEPYWIVTANETKIDLTCTHCTATDAYSKGDTCPFSQTGNRVKVKVSVGGVNGFMSDEHYLEIDTPHQLNSFDITHYGWVGPPVGFLSQISYKLYSKCGQEMFAIAMNELFTDGGDNVVPNNWPEFQPTNWPSMSGTTFVDSLTVALPDLNPPQEMPGTLQNPPRDLSSTKVKWATQEFRSGSDTSGAGVIVQRNKLQLYIDHGLHEQPIISPVN